MRGTLAELAAWAAGGAPRGEYTLVVGPPPRGSARTPTPRGRARGGGRGARPRLRPRRGPPRGRPRARRHAAGALRLADAARAPDEAEHQGADRRQADGPAAALHPAARPRRASAVDQLAPRCRPPPAGTRGGAATASCRPAGEPGVASMSGRGGETGVGLNVCSGTSPCRRTAWARVPRRGPPAPRGRAPRAPAAAGGPTVPGEDPWPSRSGPTASPRQSVRTPPAASGARRSGRNGAASRSMQRLLDLPERALAGPRLRPDRRRR